MSEHILRRRQTIEAPVEEVFAFFADAGNLERITPPELKFQILTPLPLVVRKGARIDYRLRVRGIPVRWRTEITEWDPPFLFVDTALKSPYKLWMHRHTFRTGAQGETIMEDLVRYRLPLEPLGEAVKWLVRRELNYIFDYRAKVITEIFQAETRISESE